MPDPAEEIVEEEQEVDACDQNHIEDLDPQAKIFLSTFTTIRSKIEDVTRAESELKRFELSIESERKRLQKSLEAAKLGLKNARVQMGVELQKVDLAGFEKVSQMIKDDNRNA